MRGLGVGDLGDPGDIVVPARRLPDRRRRPRYDGGYRPTCALIVPCKGAAADLGERLRAFFELVPGPERIVFAVESVEDPAHDVIQALIHDRPAATLVVAGHATTCAQMNHNLIAGVRAAGTPDVYLFADAQLAPPPGWLGELVLPLSDPEVTATTGFRRPFLGGALGAQAHAAAYFLLYTMFAFACLVSNVGLWGGAMAIRRRDLERLGVLDLWARTSTPDMSLSRLIVERRGRTVLVPACVTMSDDLLESPLAAVRWFERQCMYLKAHFGLLWGLLVGPMAVLLALEIGLPLTFLGGLAFARPAALVWLAGEVVNAGLFTLLGSTPGRIRFILWSPILRIAPTLGFVRTLWSRTIQWSGVRYRIGRAGDVISVQR